MNKVLILGGYGNFGQRIAYALAKNNIPIIIAGRDLNKAEKLKQQILSKHSLAPIQAVRLDITQDLSSELKRYRPHVVINTCGPYQLKDYYVAETCIAEQVHYIDLADGRDFVTHITQLNDKALANDVLIVSGASTVPGLSSAVIEFYLAEFSKLQSVIYGISPGQKAPRGLATTQSILTYLGKPLKPFAGSKKIPFGWQDLYVKKYPELGYRLMANCDIPDLDLFPPRYHLDTIRFSAGMESRLLHLGMWLTAWLVRLGLPMDLTHQAKVLLNFSHFFDRFGSDAGGMHMCLQGKDLNGQAKTINWFIIAKHGDGPQIPCVPAIFLTKKLVHEKLSLRGAYPCVGLITLAEYLAELKDFAIECIVT